MEQKIKMRFFFIFSMVIFLIGCLKESPLKISFSTYEPIQMNDGWQISIPSLNQINETELKKIYTDIHNDNQLWQIRSLLVFRNSNLVAESYMKTEKDSTDKKAIWSCTKQIMAELVGVAIDKGFINSIDDSIVTYLPTELQNHTDKKNITIRNLLQMQSGIAYSNSGLDGQTATIQQQIPDNILEYILNLPMNDTPASTFKYNDGNLQIVSSILKNVTKRNVDEWAFEELFSKLNIQNLTWNRYRDGTTLGSFGILTTPRELAKFGQLALDTGKWKSSQIVSANFINQMISVQVATATPKPFGLAWWIDVDREIFYMDGHGGQYVFVNPTKKLMIVITAEPNTQDDFQLSLEKGLNIYDRINKIAN